MSNKNDWLSVFWAVTASSITASSIYQANIFGCEKVPYLKRIAGKEYGTNVAVGGIIDNGTMLAVCKKLVLFVPEGGGLSSYQPEIMMVNTRYWGGNTSDIIGLFLERKDAEACFQVGNLIPLDPRWRTQTIATLQAIGSEHPYCSIATMIDGRFECPVDALLPKEEWQQRK